MGEPKNTGSTVSMTQLASIKRNGTADTKPITLEYIAARVGPDPVTAGYRVEKMGTYARFSDLRIPRFSKMKYSSFYLNPPAVLRQRRLDQRNSTYFLDRSPRRDKTTRLAFEIFCRSSLRISAALAPGIRNIINSFPTSLVSSISL